MGLKNKIALITGAAVRVGRVTALTLAEHGVNIAFTYLDDDEPWRQTLAEIEAKGVRAMALPLDVRQPEQPKAVVERVVREYGRIDILINNASVWLSSPFLDLSYEAWQAALDVNLTGPFLCAQAAAPHMLRQQSGLIINITDLSAFQTWPNYAHHAASKAGLVALTKVLAAELAPYVRVNGIAPGTVLLPPNASESKVRWAKENSLLKRIGSPEDVARTIVFLAEMDFATGAIYFMDGGRALV
ncbi:MAG: SDR family oxidoreductase [Anaerolineales bacterium]|nr:SDR family oxidoreductase [Anaerolineales bacterium]MCA9930372.1 SDR family oxidoreductase [Anaerolineales bacterium]